MTKIVFNYLVKNFLKSLFIVVLIIYSFGVILNLFEEIEFFKNINVSIFTPLLLTSLFIPSMITKLLPFIVFISSMWFMLKIRNNRDLLTLKIYGFSNIKIFFILASVSFFLGWIILIFGTPLTSSMVKYYEQTKSQYARDIDHLISLNKNGLWIKEKISDGERIITALKPDKLELINVTIFHLDENYNLRERIFSKKVNIQTENWILNDVTISSNKKGFFKNVKLDNYNIQTMYNYEKINSLFKNFDTMSFLDVVINYKNLVENGYNAKILNQNLHLMMSLPFFLCLMTALASILTLNTLRKSDNLKFIILGLIISVMIYYFKDLSFALGQTDRIPIILAIWAPIIALSFFTFIGVLQINEK